MIPVIDHINITVKDLSVAEKFYDKFLPVIGFSLDKKFKGSVKEHEFEVIEYYHPVLIFAINSPRAVFKNEIIHRRKPGSLHHLAFKAESRNEVENSTLKSKIPVPILWNRPDFILNTASIITPFISRTWKELNMKLYMNNAINFTFTK